MDSEYLENFSKYYRRLGLNLTIVDREEENHLGSFGNYLKAPVDSGESYQIHEQDDSYFESIDWGNTSGLGAVLGYNGLMCIDLDWVFSPSILNKVLAILGLPEKYDWVIATGSGLGYHIIINSPFPDKENSLLCLPPQFKSIHENLLGVLFREGEEVSSFYVVDKYRNQLEKIDFMWKLHSMLPPSKHKSGYRYRFLNTDIPATKPEFVHCARIFSLFYDLCVYNKDGYILSTSNYSDFRVKKIADPEQKVHFPEQIESEEKDLIMIFDVETNGKLKNFNTPFYDLSQVPDLLQIAWIITDGEKILGSESSWIKNDSLKIKRKIRELTGIKKETLMKIGRPINVVLDLFQKDLSRVKTLVAHNIEFDVKIVKAAFFSQGIPLDLSEKELVCTMKLSFKHKSSIPDFDENKWLKLAELFAKFFPDAEQDFQFHNSVIDAFSTYHIFRKLKELES